MRALVSSQEVHLRRKLIMGWKRQETEQVGVRNLIQSGKWRGKNEEFGGREQVTNSGKHNSGRSNSQTQQPTRKDCLLPSTWTGSAPATLFGDALKLYKLSTYVIISS